MKLLKIFLFVYPLLALVSCQMKPTKPEKPNIIFILVDDLGWKDVGFMGSTFYETPNIDKLAKDGMIFTQAYAAAAVCSPTRASILTGRYPARIGITDWIRGRYANVVIPENREYPTGYDTVPNRKLLAPKNPYWMNHEEVTLAELLKTRGYVTGHVGKWHLGPDDWSPFTQGFDFNAGGEDYGHPPSYFDPYSRGEFAINSLPSRKPGEYLTDREADEALAFIEDNKDQPFFLYLAHYAVHTPIKAKPEITSYFKEKAKRLDIPALSLEEEPTAIMYHRTPLIGQRNPEYAAMIKSVDESTGKIMDKLKELKISKNTVIVFFSDNGGHIVSTDNRPLKLGKGDPYEGGIREPLIIRWPGVTDPGSECDVPVSSIDFFPTLSSAANLEIPDSLVIDGKNLQPLLEQNGDLEPRDLYWHFPHYWWGTEVRPYSIIRSGDYKLIKLWDYGFTQLFDLSKDISERTNLVEEMPDKVEELEKKLQDWLEETNAKLPLENPLYEKK
jgi:arylsulfatase A-like enzyme